MPELKNRLNREFVPRFLERIDRRTNVGRVLWGRWDALTNDLGGEDSLSYQQRILARRVIWLEAMIEQSELAAAEGEPLEPTHHTQMINSMLGLLRTLGLERRSRDVSLTEYLAAEGEE